MPLLVAQRASHQGVDFNHHHSRHLHHHRTNQHHQLVSTGGSGGGVVVVDQQPLDFTMSKFKTSSSRHQLYRQFYSSAEDSPPYDRLEEQGTNFLKYNLRTTLNTTLFLPPKLNIFFFF